MTAISKRSHDNKVREYFLFNNSSAYFVSSKSKSEVHFILKRLLLLTALTIVIIIINLAYFLDIAKTARFYILLSEPSRCFRRR